MGLVLFVLWSCGEEPAEEPASAAPQEAHRRYAYYLRQTGLSATALGTEWLAANQSALSEPSGIPLPHRASGHFDAAKPRADGFRFSLLAGQRVEVTLELPDGTPDGLFVDLYRLPPSEYGTPTMVAGIDPETLRLSYDSVPAADYVLRVQPELLRDGRYAVDLTYGPSLSFPVEGADSGDIWSFFGDPRDGGTREHHGVDIFAPRHTPVLAPTDAYVRSVGTRDRGGNVVVLWDRERSIQLYFAHLQTQEVRSGAWVEAGEIIGTVGNTGNARTTPPHLHFGIYSRSWRPVDPFHFIHRPELPPAPPRQAIPELGTWLRVVSAGAPLHATPEGPTSPAGFGADEPMRVVDGGTPVFGIGAGAARLRVQLPDESVGYMSRAALVPAADALERHVAAEPSPVHAWPAHDAPRIGSLAPGSTVELLGRFADYGFFRTPQGRPAWLLLASQA